MKRQGVFPFTAIIGQEEMKRRSYSMWSIPD